MSWVSIVTMWEEMVARHPSMRMGSKEALNWAILVETHNGKPEDVELILELAVRLERKDPL